MIYHAGLDVSLSSTNIRVIDDQGELIAEGKTDAEAADIVDFPDEPGVEVVEVGLEAGTLVQCLRSAVRWLRSHWRTKSAASSESSRLSCHPNQEMVPLIPRYGRSLRPTSCCRSCHCPCRMHA